MDTPPNFVGVKVPPRAFLRPGISYIVHLRNRLRNWLRDLLAIPLQERLSVHHTDCLSSSLDLNFLNEMREPAAVVANCH